MKIFSSLVILSQCLPYIIDGAERINECKYYLAGIGLHHFGVTSEVVFMFSFSFSPCIVALFVVHNSCTHE